MHAELYEAGKLSSARVDYSEFPRYIERDSVYLSNRIKGKISGFINCSDMKATEEASNSLKESRTHSSRLSETLLLVSNNKVLAILTDKGADLFYVFEPCKLANFDCGPSALCVLSSIQSLSAVNAYLIETLLNESKGCDVIEYTITSTNLFQLSCKPRSKLAHDCVEIKNDAEKVVQKFKNSVSMGPVYVCSCCYQTWFKDGVREKTSTWLSKLPNSLKECFFFQYEKL